MTVLGEGADIRRRETAAMYFVEHCGYSIADAAHKAGVSEFWLNQKVPDSRKLKLEHGNIQQTGGNKSVTGRV